MAPAASRSQKGLGLSYCHGRPSLHDSVLASKGNTDYLSACRFARREGPKSSLPTYPPPRSPPEGGTTACPRVQRGPGLDIALVKR